MIIPKPLPADGNRHWKVTTGPVVEPITVEELKLFARIDGADEDLLLEGFIEAVRGNAEAYLGQALISQTITMQMDYWPSETIELPRPPLISITGVYTLDEDDVATEYSSDYYYAITWAVPGLLVLRQGVSPPENTERDYGGYQVVFVAGYGEEATDVPQGIRDGLMLWAATTYEKRMPSASPPPDAMILLKPYRVIKI